MSEPAPALPRCVHCRGLSAWIRRGLCHKCHKIPAVRDQHQRGKTGPKASAGRPALPDGKRWKAMRPGEARSALAALDTPAAGRMVVVCNVDPDRGLRLVGYDGGLASAGGSVLFELRFPVADPDRAYVHGLILGAIEQAAQIASRRLTNGGDGAE